MRRIPLDKPSKTSGDGLRQFLALTVLSVTGPAVLSAYVFAGWSLTADMGFTHSFPWSAGPLSNWIIWLGAALLLTLVKSALHPRLETRAGSNHKF